MAEELIPQQQPEQEKQQELPTTEIPKELQEFEELLEDLPEENRSAFRALIFAIEQRTSWRGPLPPPDKLKEYNDAVPDGAERILKTAEKQAEHRMAMEKQAIPEDQRQSRHGQHFAFIIALSFLIVSGLLIWDGHDAAGTVIGTVDLVALCVAFIAGRRNQNRDD
jgi:uncharacterized membrane protein